MFGVSVVLYEEVLYRRYVCALHHTSSVLRVLRAKREVSKLPILRVFVNSV